MELCPNGHEKTGENIYHWRGLKLCMQCRRDVNRERQRRLRADAKAWRETNGG
ncbi:hypothetical protein [Qaidamihabitans albus]|uniref:hypothetical protein n=1 Tax=Qaidamihabitans albus TaxID=2795733 RepID=UPI0018F13B91|nr:hypothetical protein [Qaidamihabitans albus]